MMVATEELDNTIEQFVEELQKTLSVFAGDAKIELDSLEKEIEDLKEDKDDLEEKLEEAKASEGAAEKLKVFADPRNWKGNVWSPAIALYSDPVEFAERGRVI